MTSGITNPKLIKITGNTISSSVNTTADVALRFGTTTGVGYLVADNYVRLNAAAGGVALEAGSFGTNATVVNNIWGNSNTATTGTAVVASANRSLTV